MLFPEDALFGFVLCDLTEELERYPTPSAQRLNCDRYVARSAMQKAIRRGDVDTAQKALANLLEEDKASVWRHLTVIALEDVGVANVDILARIMAARQNRGWRNQAGGDWAVAADLVRQMAESNHCQAVCDLLLQITNSADFEKQRLFAVTASQQLLARCVADADLKLEHRAIAALALGGRLVENQPGGDAARVFCALSLGGCSSHIVAVCQAAWRACRNEMAFLLPLIWTEWMNEEGCRVADDEFSEAKWVAGVPAYAIDQFTRVGGAVARAYGAMSIEMKELMDEVSLPVGKRGRAIGDLIFLIEGSTLVRRVLWPVGERLRAPVRPLATIKLWGEQLTRALAVLRSQGALIQELRTQHLHSPSKTIQP